MPAERAAGVQEHDVPNGGSLLLVVGNVALGPADALLVQGVWGVSVHLHHHALLHLGGHHLPLDALGHAHGRDGGGPGRGVAGGLLELGAREGAPPPGQHAAPELGGHAGALRRARRGRGRLARAAGGGRRGGGAGGERGRQPPGAHGGGPRGPGLTPAGRLRNRGVDWTAVIAVLSASVASKIPDLR